MILWNRRSIKMMGSYKYIVIGIMIILVIYSLSIDLKYPYTLRNTVIDKLHTAQEYIPPKNQKNQTTFCTLYSVTHNYNAQFDCVQTKTSPKTSVCLYSSFDDWYISHDIKETGVWEPQVTNDFLEVLRQDSELGVIDIGANIGYYSMLAVAMDRKVVAVEPYLPSIHRLHRAVEIMDKHKYITVLHNAVWGQRIKGTIKLASGNLGDIQVKPFSEPCLGSCPTTVNIILLDDLLEVVNFPKALLKIDIQGWEHHAFKYANSLLTRVNVTHIFMEWGVMREFGGNTTNTDTYLVDQMVKVLFHHGFRPYELSANGGNPLDPNTWFDWPFDIIWRRNVQKKEVETVLRNHFLNWP